MTGLNPCTQSCDLGPQAGGDPAQARYQTGFGLSVGQRRPLPAAPRNKRQSQPQSRAAGEEPSVTASAVLRPWVYSPKTVLFF